MTATTQKPAIEFSQNWNKKLHCKYFTTIRLSNPQKYYVGCTHKVKVQGIYHFDARIEAITHQYLKDLSEIMCYLDTGYSKAETMALFKKMYPKYDFEQNTISIILYKSELE